MDRLVHTTLSAMRGAMARQTAIANNLANANTVGFRAEIANSRALWINGAGSLSSRAQSSEEVLGADMRGGEIQETGRDLDVALDGDALLAVQGPDGSEAYSRRGDLQLSDSGLVTTGEGHVVFGEGGPITMPPADAMRIDKDGTIWIVPQGGDPNLPQPVDKLKLVSPAGSTIAKGLDGLFRVKAGGTLPADPDARVTGRSLESSNVDATKSLIDMIEASRGWDTQIQLITSARDMDSASADLMRLP